MKDNTKEKKFFLLTILALIFFVIIRVGLFLYAYESRSTVIEPDDSFAYLLKAQILFSDPFYQSKSLAFFKSKLKESDKEVYYNKLWNLRILSRYHLGWSAIVGSAHKTLGFKYVTIWWFLLFIGQLLLIFGFYKILISLDFSYDLRAISIILFTLILYKVEHTSTMAPREWAFVAFFYLLPLVFSYKNYYSFTVFDAFTIILLTVFGSLSHPRFFILLPIVGLFIVIYYFKRILKREPSIIKLILFLTISPLTIIIIHKISSAYHFPFLGFSDDFSIMNNISSINFSTLSTNLFPAAMILIKILGYVSFFYIDAIVLIILGIIFTIKKNRLLFCFSVSLFICSTGLLFLYFPKHPGQYFYMYNSVFALFFVIFETLGLHFLANIISKRKKSFSYIIPGFLILLIIFQFSLFLSKGFDIINRSNISNPVDFIDKINYSFSNDKNLMFIHQVPLYAYLMQGNYNRKIDISTVKDLSKTDNKDDYIVGSYNLNWTPKGFLLKNEEYIRFSFENVYNFKEFFLSLETDSPENLFFEFFIDDLSLYRYSFSELIDNKSLKFTSVKISYIGKGQTYLHRFTNAINDTSLLPVLIPYKIDYILQKRVIYNWRTKLLSFIGLLPEKNHQGIIHTKFNTRMNNTLNLKIMKNDGVFFIAERTP
ncbi:membrane protein [Candidatus Magnetomorum sp. HK-1]|nr:membrane protein [Candidatus Magnetomorum sp. HK-1]